MVADILLNITYIHLNPTKSFLTIFSSLRGAIYQTSRLLDYDDDDYNNIIILIIIIIRI